jgi:ribosomal protein S6
MERFIVKTYEAMFLMDASLATDWPTAEAEVKRILERAGANVLGLKNWDERKLAQPIRQHKRGLYALSFFEAPPDKISGIERDVHLSEKAVRVLVLRRENLTPERIQRALTAAPPPKTSSRASDEWSGGRYRSGGEPREAEGPATEPATAVAVDDIPEIDVLNA